MRLAYALHGSAAAAGVALAVTPRDVVPWASITFTGERHTVALAGTGAAFDLWLDALADAELAVAGWLVADCAVVARDAAGATVEVLLLAT